GAAVAAGQQPVLAAVLQQVLAVGAAAAEAAFVAAGIEQGQHQVDEVAPVHGREQGAASLAALARELEAVEEEGAGQAGRDQDGCRSEDRGQGRRSWSMRRSSDSMVPFIAENSMPRVALTWTAPGCSAMRPSTPLRLKCRVSPSQR